MTIERAADSAEQRKARGAFFTPPELTRFLCDWAITSPADRVLEPSCGDGAFLEAGVRRMRHLGGRAPIQAHELHADSARDARRLLDSLDHPGQVIVGDFLGAPATATFDAVVGNPPYIRYQGFTGEARATGLAAALAQGVRLSRLASSWAPFVVHAAGFLVPTGRLGLVLPAELLSSNYAQGVRDFVLRRFADVRIVVIGAQVFAGVQTEALLLLAEGSGGTDRVHFATVDDVADLDGVDFGTILDVGPGARWTSALVSSDAQRELARLVEGGYVAPLASWGRLSLGAVTGNNRYFTMSPAEASNLGLAASDVTPISPAGSSHLRAVTFTHADHDAMGRTGASTLLFRPETPSAAARDYIDHGERLGVHLAYKCRARTPWWRTPMPAPPDLFFTYMNQTTPQLAANPARLGYVNSVHGLYFAPEAHGLAELLALASLNSATALSAEISGRAYGGGVLKMEPREAIRLLVPSIDTVVAYRTHLAELLPHVRRLLTAGDVAAARERVDEVLLGPRATSAAAVGALRAAYAMASARRLDRAKSRLTRTETT